MYVSIHIILIYRRWKLMYSLPLRIWFILLLKLFKQTLNALLSQIHKCRVIILILSWIVLIFDFKDIGLNNFRFRALRGHHLRTASNSKRHQLYKLILSLVKSLLLMVLLLEAITSFLNTNGRESLWRGEINHLFRDHLHSSSSLQSHP